MDSLTQIVLGAAVGEVVLGKKVGNKAILWGAIAGTIPDLDVYQSLFYDPLTANELHRGVTHSILFSVVMAPLLGWLVKYKEKLGFAIMMALILGYLFIQLSNPVARIVIGIVFAGIVFIKYRQTQTDIATKGNWSWLFFWGLLTHPLLDCHTTWGTQLLWPLPYKLAFNNIFVADLFYTVPFLICVAIAMFFHRQSKQRARWNWAGIIVSSAYMLWSLGAKWNAHTIFTRNLNEQNIEYTRLTSTPTPLNTFLWQSTADCDTSYRVGLHSIFDDNDSVEFINIPNNHQLLSDYKDEDVVKRLKYLSKEWYVVEKGRGDTIIYYDARFGPMYDGKSDPKYMFGYQLIPGKDGLEVRQERPNPSDMDMSEQFKILIERIKGK